MITKLWKADQEMFLQLTFRRFDPHANRGELIQWLTAEEWPFHVYSSLVAGDVVGRLTAGGFDPPGSELYWITQADARVVGLLHVFDLDDVADEGPSFDIRLASAARGQGFGVQTVRWLNDELFGRYPELQRISATTRADNRAMKSILSRCGYAKEGHFRQTWPTSDGRRLDSLELQHSARRLGDRHRYPSQLGGRPIGQSGLKLKVTPTPTFVTAPRNSTSWRGLACRMATA